MEGTELFHILPLQMHYSWLSTSCTGGAHLLQFDETTVTRHNYPKSVVHIRVHSCTFCGFRHIYWQLPTIIVSYGIVSLSLKILCALPIHSYPPQPSDLFTVSIVLFFPKCLIVGITQYAVFSGWLYSLNDRHLNFLFAFSWLDNSFLFSAE